METAIYWIELIATTKGAPHLQSVATHFHTFFYYNLDVWTAISFIFILFVFILWKIFSIIIIHVMKNRGLKRP